jgi:uncharacterized protein YndB with AHSA1/START domain
VSQVRAHVDIAAPPERVFAFFDDLTNAAVLVPNLVQVTSVEELPTGGRRVEYTTRNKNGVLVEASSEHVVYEPPRRTVTRSQQSGVASTSTREFGGLPSGGTRVEAMIEWSAPVKYLGSIVGAPLRRPFHRALRHSLLAAKEALESGPASLSAE